MEMVMFPIQHQHGSADARGKVKRSISGKEGVMFAASGVVHDDVTGELGVLGKEQQRRNPASAVRRAV